MIIIGYPGIGKSTLSTTKEQYVDMESSRFIFNGVRPVRWAYFYARMAEDISRQGYRVFVSMHKEVVENLKFNDEKVVIVCPALELKEQWIEKLKTRWELEPSHKNYAAWQRAVKYYDMDINATKCYPFRVIKIYHMGYDLGDLLENELSEE